MFTPSCPPPPRDPPVARCRSLWRRVARGDRAPSSPERDDAALRALIVRALRRAGFVVSGARDGLELMEIAAATVREEGAPPELVVTDVRMPGRSGVEALAALRARLGRRDPGHHRLRRRGGSASPPRPAAPSACSTSPELAEAPPRSPRASSADQGVAAARPGIAMKVVTKLLLGVARSRRRDQGHQRGSCGFAASGRSSPRTWPATTPSSGERWPPPGAIARGATEAAADAMLRVADGALPSRAGARRARGALRRRPRGGVRHLPPLRAP